jgi:magnesium transporter
MSKKNIGAPPGEIIYTGKVRQERIRITMFEYNETELIENEYYDFSACITDVKPNMIKWINFDGVHNTELIEKIGSVFKIHPLTLEDIVNIEQRPKLDEYDEYLYIVLRMIFYDEKLRSEQLSIILLDNTVISFQEPQSGDAFDIIRNRLRQGKGRVRRKGADYLAYALVDAVIDHYFSAVDKVGERIEILEEKIGRQSHHHNMHDYRSIHSELYALKKQIVPVRELITTMMRSETELLTESTHLYLRDISDHSIRVVETLEGYRESLSGLMNVYLSNNNYKLSEVMKTLTVITSIFIPVTFIVGVYGMNFKFMPELYHPYGYWTIWAIMIFVMGGMAYYFKRKKWW